MRVTRDEIQYVLIRRRVTAKYKCRFAPSARRLYGCHCCRSFRAEFQSEIVAGIVEADILDDRPDPPFITRQFASLHFAAEEIAEYAAIIFMMQRSAVPASSTVPAPISTSEPMLLARWEITSTAPGTVMVISTIGIPPARTASAASIACFADDARTTGTMPISVIRSLTSCFFITFRLLTRDSRTRSTHHLQNFRKGRHGSVTRCCHSQSAMRGSAFHCPPRPLAGKKTVDPSRGKRISASYAIEDLQVFPIFRLIKITVGIADGAPVIEGRGFRFAQRSGDYGKRKFLDHSLNHLLESFGFYV